ncbi:MAG: response regulator [Bacteroidales bacterium]
MIRLFSIEDHWLVTDGLRTKFRGSRDGIAISCSATTLENALTGNREQEFDIILLDLFIPDTEPIENIRLLIERYPDKPVVVLTAEDHEIWKIQMFESGAMAYLTKHTSKKEMIEVIKRVFRGENVLSEQLAPILSMQQNSHGHRHLFHLNPSERLLLSQLAQGYPQKQIADRMKISESSLEKLLGKLRKQFSAANTVELIRMLERHHFFPGLENDLPRK